jgi:hypothetical protein
LVAQNNKNTVKFALGSILNYTQVYMKIKDESPTFMSPFDAIGNHGGLQHIMMAIGRSLEALDFESLLYGAKIIINLS